MTRDCTRPAEVGYPGIQPKVSSLLVDTTVTFRGVSDSYFRCFNRYTINNMHRIKLYVPKYVCIQLSEVNNTHRLIFIAFPFRPIRPLRSLDAVSVSNYKIVTIGIYAWIPGLQLCESDVLALFNQIAIVPRFNCIPRIATRCRSFSRLDRAPKQSFDRLYLPLVVGAGGASVMLVLLAGAVLFQEAVGSTQ